LLEIAQFYDKQGKQTSAALYYEEILADYPDTEQAVDAYDRLQVIQPDAGNP